MSVVWFVVILVVVFVTFGRREKYTSGTYVIGDDNVDFPGGDIGFVRKKTFQQCQDMCNRDPRCMAFVTARDRCWLKGEAAITKSNAVATRGRKTYVKTEFARSVPRPYQYTTRTCRGWDYNGNCAMYACPYGWQETGTDVNPCRR